MFFYFSTSLPPHTTSSDTHHRCWLVDSRNNKEEEIFDEEEEDESVINISSMLVARKINFLLPGYIFIIYCIIVKKDRQFIAGGVRWVVVFFYFSHSIPPYRMFLNNINIRHQCWWTNYRSLYDIAGKSMTRMNRTRGRKKREKT